MSWIAKPLRSSPTLSKEVLTELVSNPRTSAAKVTNMATTSWTNSITSRLRWRSDRSGRTRKPSVLQPSRMTRTTAASNKAITRYRLFPVGRDDRVVVGENQVEPVWIVRDASDAARRYDPPQYLGEILLTNDPLLTRLRLGAFDTLLADAVLTVVV